VKIKRSYESGSKNLPAYRYICHEKAQHLSSIQRGVVESAYMSFYVDQSN
jgi:hypothetical protein